MLRVGKHLESAASLLQKETDDAGDQQLLPSQ